MMRRELGGGRESHDSHCTAGSQEMGGDAVGTTWEGSDIFERKEKG